MTQIVRPSVKLGGAFQLTDHNGRTVTDRTFLGSCPLIFFGFTHCKVVCPENLGKLSRALGLMGPVAEQLQPLYVSVDPERDTPQVMRAFLQSRFPRFLGLTGDRAQVDAIKAAYKVYAAREAADADGAYDVPHTAMTFLMGEDGGYLTHFSDVATAEDIAARVMQILSTRGASSPA
ncbi:SCO family protein [Caulobacter sp. KR2-114]|uniref:SCO family protein n=1 Tax=Caulobacter sp. KR2-114 TaxID=3400912 RepID=UPI003C027837